MITKRSTILLWAYAAVLIALNISRCFDNVYWGDECFSINLVQKTVDEVVSLTAADVHPPLYYLWLKAFTSVFPGAYHQASVAVFVVATVIVLTWFRRRFGAKAALLMLTLCSLTYTGARYAVEVRMYGMAAMWELVAFLALYDVLRTGRWRYYIVMAAASVAAAYTHYYALLAVSLLWLYLIIHTIATRKGQWRVAICAASAVVVFLPWVRTLLAAVEKKAMIEHGASALPSITKMLAYPFYVSDDHSTSSLVVNALMLIVYLAVLIMLLIGPIVRRNRYAYLEHWALAGQVSFYGTALIGFLSCLFLGGSYMNRYLFPASVAVWAVLSVGMTRLRWRWATPLLAAACVAFYGTVCARVYQRERQYAREMSEIVEKTQAIGSGAVIVTDLNHICWTIGEYYWPGATCLGWDSEWPTVSDIWVMRSATLSPEETTKLGATGFVVEPVTEGHIGGEQYYAHIYHLHRSR